MRARYEATYNRNDTVDLKLSGVTILGYEQSDPERSDDHVTLGMSADAFEFLTGDKVRAKLERDLNDARSEIQRVSHERDEVKRLEGHRRRQVEWERQQRADAERDLDEVTRRIEQLTEERDRMTAQRDEAVRKAAVVDALRPIRMTIPVELFTKPSDDVDELKATIVRQAREITRLKGESE